MIEERSLSPAFDILGLGTLAVDDVLYVAAYPPPDAKARVMRRTRGCGGQIGTALAAAARLGVRCAYAGVLGTDELSTVLRRQLERAGVDCGGIVEREDAGPVYSVIIADERTGSRNIFFDAARQQALPAERIAPQLVAQARVLLLDQLALGTDSAPARVARHLSIPVVADLEWPERTPPLDAIDHLIVPWQYAAAFTGATDPPTALRRLHEPTARSCTAITCGPEGCYYVMASRADQVCHLPALAVQAVETTGCGDVFHGAYAAALAQGADVPSALLSATVAAAVYAERPSGWAYLPTADDVAALRARCGV